MKAELERLVEHFRARARRAISEAGRGNSYRMGEHDTNELCADELQAILTRSDWIPVSERLPEREGWYLASNPHTSVSFPAYWVGGMWFSSPDYQPERVNVHHWQELPAPYRAEGADQ